MNCVFTLWILSILLVHSNAGAGWSTSGHGHAANSGNVPLPTQNSTGNLDGASSSSNISNTDGNEKKFPYLHSSLAWIFLLLEWLAANWPELTKLPDIVEGMVISKNLKTKNTEELVNLAAYFKNYLYREKGKEKEKEDKENERKAILKKRQNGANYPNTKELTFGPILEGVFNKVDNTASEITTGLLSETFPGEDENERRLRHKNEFRFAFMVDCIYAAYMDTEGRIKFQEIFQNIKRPTPPASTEEDEEEEEEEEEEDEEGMEAGLMAQNVHHTLHQNVEVPFVRYERVEDHPFYGILTKNKCAEDEVIIEAFVRIFLHQFYEKYECERADVYNFFHNEVLPQFLETMKKKLTKKEREEEKRMKLVMRGKEKRSGIVEKKRASVPIPLYFPERMPKIANLSQLVFLLISIIQSLAETISPTEPLRTRRFQTKIYDIFAGTIDGINNIRRLLHFMIRNGQHYKKAFNELPAEMKEKISKITPRQSFVTYVLNEKHLYHHWTDEIYQVHLIKHLAINVFELPADQMPADPNTEVDNRANEQYYELLLKRIVREILYGYYEMQISNVSRHFIRGQTNLRQQLNDRLFHQLQRNVFCVGLQELKVKRQKYRNLAEFYTDFKLQLLPVLALIDQQRALRILHKMEDVVVQFMNLKIGEEKVMTWEERMLEGIQKIYTKFCGPQRVQV